MNTNGWTQEIRFAGVFFGGVSLAIYMNGVAQELFRIVRATADLDPAQLDPVEKIYRQLGQILYLGRIPPDTRPEFDQLPAAPKESDPVRTRFVIDILSGTSAGGINAVALAKALALRLPSMEVLGDTWRDDADLQTLLNDRESDLRTYPKLGGRTTSLLNSEKMYAIIHRTLAKMSETARPADGRRGFADEIDLFVTATDLNGLWKPIQLADKKIDERQHKTVFRFRYADPALEAELGMEPRNEFVGAYDPMLAFSARCTSSFPVAFEPMTLEKIKPTLIRNNLCTFETAKAKFQPFFADYKYAGQPPFDRRLFADGGYLDNKPFSYAIDTIRYRTAQLPATRKLIYLDPFPENAADWPFRDKISFFKNAQLAATGLPRYETIRGDIEAINRSNRLQERLGMLRRNVDEALDCDDTSAKPPTFNLDSTLKQRVSQLGAAYTVYHQLRVAEVTSGIAAMIARLADVNEDSDWFIFVRSITRAWRFHTYHKDKADSKISENRFLHDFDMAYRLRRLNHVRRQIDYALQEQMQKGKGRPADQHLHDAFGKARLDVEREMVRLRQGGARLCSPRRSPLKEAVMALHDAITSKYEVVMGAPDRDQRDNAAKEIYDTEQYGAVIRNIVDMLRQQLAVLFDDDKAIEQKAEGWPENIRLKFWRFVYHDMVTVPFLAGTDVYEYNYTEVYRIGPTDAALWPKKVLRPDKKLAGTQTFNFGGFMSRPWRDNDMMWGRLDAADRIVTALLPAATDATLREHYIKMLQDAILKQELAIDKDDRIAQWFLRYAGLNPASRRDQRECGRKPGDSQQPMVKSKSLFGVVFSRIGRVIIPGLKERDLLHQAIKALKKTPAGILVRNANYREFVEIYYQTPPPPSTDALTNWIGRGLTIFGSMVDDDGVAQPHTPVGRSIRTLGVTTTKIVRFTMPNTLRQRIVRDWLGVLAISGVPLALAGLIFGKPDLTSFGVGVAVVFLLLILLQQAVGVHLSGRSTLTRVLRVPLFFVAAILLLFIVHGVTDVWSWLQTYLDRLIG